jgi:hypothetical protein
MRKEIVVERVLETEFYRVIVFDVEHAPEYDCDFCEIVDIMEADITQFNWVARRVEQLTFYDDVTFQNKVDFGRAKNIRSKLRKAVNAVLKG